MTRDEITRDEIKEILLASRNIILHGAPGTGKTYLAKEIAMSLCGVSDIKELEKSGRFKMVQFHPSYDYTDFVEGLRPEDDGKGNIVFKRKDGVFKQFCKRAINTQTISIGDTIATYDADIINKNEIEAAWDELLSQYIDNVWSEIDLKSRGYKAPIKRRHNTLIFIKSKQKDYNDKKNQEVATCDTFCKLFNKFNNKLSDIKNIKQKDLEDIIWCKSTANAIRRKLYDIILKNRIRNTSMPATYDVKQPFLFLIDEINRGDLSKIFGELFYAIDPGYPGEEGKIDTQYQNLIPKDGDNDFKPDKADPFRDGFYIPENVYIIGTMNDIDRSVESMDFAMRRRFQFIEVTAEMSARNMEIPEDIKRRMENLNRSIVEDMKLSTSFQIGASYFLKLKDGKESADELWRYRLEGLLREYLRGEDDIDVKIKRLEEAYNKPADNNTAHETNNVI